MFTSPPAEIPIGFEALRHTEKIRLWAEARTYILRRWCSNDERAACAAGISYGHEIHMNALSYSHLSIFQWNIGKQIKSALPCMLDV